MVHFDNKEDRRMAEHDGVVVVSDSGNPQNGSLMSGVLPLDISLGGVKTVGELYDYCIRTGDISPAIRGHAAVWRLFSKTPDGKLPKALAEVDDPYTRRLFADRDTSYKYYPMFAPEFFDWEAELAEIGRYFMDAMSGGDAKKQILCLWGGHGCGKTSFVRYLARLMAKGAYYAVGELGDREKKLRCRHHCHWLYLVPEEERGVWHNRFGYFEGEPCADCAGMLIACAGNWRQIPVERRPFLLRAGCGIVHCEGKLPPPAQGGALPHEWYNALFAANGGMFVTDLDKQPSEFVSLIAQAVMDGAVPLADHISWANLDCVFVHVGNTNPVGLTNQHTELRDRLYSVGIRAPLSWLAERRLFQKRARERTQSSAHFMPHVEETLALLLCASRMDDRCPKVENSLWDKARLHAGEQVLRKGTVLTVTRRQLFESEGNSQEEGRMGILPRLSVRMHGLAIQQNSCVGIGDILASAHACIKSDDASVVGAEAKQRLKDLLGEELQERTKQTKSGIAEDRYRRAVEMDLVTAILGLETAVEYRAELFGRYLDHAGAYTNKTDVEVDAGAGKKEKRQPDTSFLKSIEERGEVSGSSADKFRQEVVSFFFQIHRREERIGTLEDHQQLAEMIETFIKRERSGKVRALLGTIFGGGGTPSQKDEQDRLRKNLGDMGYRDCCIEAVLLYAYRHVFTS